MLTILNILLAVSILVWVALVVLGVVVVRILLRRAAVTTTTIAEPGVHPER